MEAITRKKLRELRLSKGLSMRQLSKIIGVSFASISRFERGSSPDELTLQRFLDFTENKKSKIKVNKLSVKDHLSLLQERLRRLENYVWKK